MCLCKGQTPTSHRKALYKLYGFVGRYAHQPMSEMMRMTRSELKDFAGEVGEILEEESEAARRGTDGF